ncbi:adenosylcobinamide-phosphate synthase [Parvibaculum indicum]|uniref:adenosylcobinamide-phosphate synthase CbiB n=1 Tax=Parvibaculum indicum TaxID=562969 RepID=UPI0014235669|nr:adenosylcobinamide-phosphate synthase CbiB [Parvibaculum indicum]NIJ41950.1 adenosylcobinamide-phosphate synthase [Parvibaculum indicum]
MIVLSLTGPALAFLALAAEGAFGYPQALFRAIGHPVTWMGHLISAAERQLNRERMDDGKRFAGGCVLVVLLLSISVACGHALHLFLASLPFGWIGEILIASAFVASRSLAEHIRDVAHALDDDGIAGGRIAVAKIVGRNPADLDEHGVSRAAVESLAENYSDGIVAPLFWCAVAGLPGLIAYKAINTADSMIGHRNARYEYFGKAAARLDDLANLIPARVCGCLVAASAQPAHRIGHPFSIMWRDAGKHLSPNAGWPEAAMAGALDIRLGGPRSYGAVRTEGAWLGDGKADLTSRDIRNALHIYRRSWVLLALLLAFIAVSIGMTV